MAASSSNPSFIVEIGDKYPSPSHVCTPSLVTVKLSGKDSYYAWKTQILCLLKSHNMLGFINGKVVKPEGNMHRIEAWMRSDTIVKSWILGTLSEEVTMHVLKCLTSNNPNVDFTAKHVWDKLECIYGPEIIQQAIGETEIAIKDDAKSEDNSIEEETNEEESETDSLSLQYFEKELYRGIVEQKIDLVNYLLDEGEVSVTDIITKNGNTTLHVAVDTSNSKGLEFFKMMLKKTPENIRLTDLKNSDGSTLLHMAATVGNIEAAKFLMQKYPNMLYETDKEGQTPLIVALSNTHTNFYWCLLESINKGFVRRDNTLFSDKLLELAISNKDFNLAWSCIRLRRGTLDSDAVLMAIAQNFPRELSFWERISAEFIYTPILKGATILKGAPILKVRVFQFVEKRLQKRLQAFNVLEGVCDIIQKRSSDHRKYYNYPVLEATRQNALDVVKGIVYHFPSAFWSETEDGHKVIQYAVINRSEKIYNLLYEMSEHRNVYKTIKDASRNNLLHLAARLAPAEKLILISGAALQIQYELQWYKEVENFVSPLNITEKNSFGETPQMVFTRTHKALVSDGEKWMRSTAESYTITAALITTIVFAAAITVPGGNTQDTGVPIFTNNPAFTIFAVSDAISLFTSVMSLLMFLSILTARFAEENFLVKLPRKLIIGLVALFISTTTMIIAFGAASFIVFGQNNRSLLIPIGALTGLTITFFVALQFPLVVDLIRATYCRKIFGKRNAISKKWLQNYINKMTCQPIVKDKKEEKKNMMEIDWTNVHDYSRYKFVNCDDIPFNI